jgi:hypothetical protein
VNSVTIDLSNSLGTNQINDNTTGTNDIKVISSLTYKAGLHATNTTSGLEVGIDNDGSHSFSANLTGSATENDKFTFTALNNKNATITLSGDLGSGQTGTDVTIDAGTNITTNSNSATINISALTHYNSASITGSAGNDTITVGTGSNSITGGTGVDTITLNSGADTVVYTSTNDGKNLANNTNNGDTINNFDTDNDKIDVSATALALAGSTGNYTTASSSSTASSEAYKVIVVTDSTASDWSNVLTVLNSAIQYDASDDDSTTSDKSIVVVDNGTDSRVYYLDEDGTDTANNQIDDGEIYLLATLKGVTTDDLSSSDFVI